MQTLKASTAVSHVISPEPSGPQHMSTQSLEASSAINSTSSFRAQPTASGRSSDQGPDEGSDIKVIDVHIGSDHLSSTIAQGQDLHAPSGSRDDAIKKHFYHHYNHGGPRCAYGQVDERQISVLTSFRRRFRHLSFPTISGRSPLKVSHEAFRYTVANMGVKYCFVEDANDRQLLLEFCHHNTVIAIHTESAPAPFNKSIDLVQISNSNDAFLCPLRPNDHEHLKKIATILFSDASKRVLQFGMGDIEKFLNALGIRIDIQCSVINVQERLRVQAGLDKDKPPSLPTCVINHFGNQRVLSTAWTNSGWDNIPLHQEQKEYATLDVIFTFRLGQNMH